MLDCCTSKDKTLKLELDLQLALIESDEPISITEVLDRLNIASSTVLAVLGETIVPHSSTITDDIEIELIVVSSGG